METTEKESFPTLSSLEDELPILPHYLSSSEEEEDDYVIREIVEVSLSSTDSEDEGEDARGFHMMTKAEYREYLPVAMASGGYDVIEVPRAKGFHIIVPMSQSAIEQNNLSSHCQKALDKYNEMEGMELQFVEVVKANMQDLFWFYITFKVMDPHNHDEPYKIFQAYVFDRFTPEEFTVLEVRLKPMA